MARYERKIYNLALRMLRDPDDAREILQETFLKVYDNLEKFRGEAHLSTWIYRIAMNEALMRIRKNKRRPRSLDTFIEDDGGTRELEVEDWAPLPLERALTRELGGKLDRAVARLPEDYRGAFLLRDVEGLSNEQIARAMKLSVPAVKSRIHRARVFLRNELAKYAAGRRRVN
jgi:RNA polymerase sigma-70 factor (ECF subfamily)